MGRSVERSRRSPSPTSRLLSASATHPLACSLTIARDLRIMLVEPCAYLAVDQFQIGEVGPLRRREHRTADHDQLPVPADMAPIAERQAVTQVVLRGAA